VTRRHPFHIGQSADAARIVAQRTNRRRTAVQFTASEGTFRLDLKHDNEREISEWRDEQRFTPQTVTEVRWEFPELTLVFRYDGKWFSIMEILKGQKDGRD